MNRNTLKTLRLLAVAVATTIFAGSAIASAEAGKKKAEPCKACHGEGGMSKSPDFPVLAGQNADYIVAVLTHYKNGKRKNPIMQGQVANLSVRDINDLAAYYSSQTGLMVRY